MPRNEDINEGAGGDGCVQLKDPSQDLKLQAIRTAQDPADDGGNALAADPVESLAVGRGRLGRQDSIQEYNPVGGVSAMLTEAL